MFLPVVITAALVSLDALFVGMSLALQKNFKRSYLLVIAAIIFVMSTIAYLAAGALRASIGFETSWIVGGAFVVLGVRNLFAKDEEKMTLSIGTIIALGLVMSIDGMVGAVAVTLEHGKTFLSPVLMGAGHLLFLLAGSFAARFVQTSHRVHNIISASCLFFVALLNFMGAL